MRLLPVVALIALVVVPAPAAAAQPAGCDPLGSGTGECLLPFPNDWHTRPDPATPTGRRLALTPDVLPRNALGSAPNPTPWNRADGFSPGSTLIAHVPGLDPATSGLAPVTDIGRSLDADAPVVLLDAATGERWPHWAELDANDPQRRALLVHPARNLRDGHRYVVALRGLRDAAGGAIVPNPAFARVAGPDLAEDDPLRARQQQLRPALAALAAHGVDPRAAHVAWDFTVASTRSLTGDLFTIRDDALRELGSRAPASTVTGVTDFTPEQDARIAREITGRVTVPSYLTLPGGLPGSVLRRASDGTPRRSLFGPVDAQFRCEVPRSAFAQPSWPALYGHGLLGSRSEVGAGNVKAMAAEHGFTFCATDWIGMAQDDIPVVLAALADITLFAAIPERSQQGILNAIFVGRALAHPQGLVAHQAFRTDDGRPLVDTTRPLVFDGNSQGGILGGALVAASPDVRTAVLGVTGMNYGVLLNRSSDFAPFHQVLDLSYPDRLRQQVVLQLLQLLWDRGETNGYANHLGDRRVLMHIAFGDHQVANVAADVEARTIGARLVTPALAPGRSPDRVPHWGIEPARLPHAGSAMVVWDSGTPAPPTTNTPPTEPEYGRDPHSDPRSSVDARRQKAAFLTTGLVVDVCGGAPCTAPPTG
ncbi:hypothetical protein [Saccharothrix syringae]|uniref:ATP-dependent DNA helicase RecG n=1 Tax=Saccharothrix syringae TaxID=103733 RepID=A0A5Q0GYA5_SACSY|nr:hypothetical protein [Saccharothrix syringae]QFZ18929.1 hypothetical protein EKG83_17055 [Saccharothrix syringae]